MSFRRLAGVLLAFALAAAVAHARPEPSGPPSEREEVLERFPLPKDERLLLLPVELQGKTYLFALDTGSSKTVYDTSLEPLLGNPLSTEEVGTGSGKLTVRCFQPPDARLGKLRLAQGDPVFTADLRPVREATDEEIFGVIGMDFLGGQVFRIDPDRGEVVFFRSAGPGLGLHVDPERGAVVVVRSAEPGLGCRVPVTFDESRRPCVEARLAGMDHPEPFLIDTGNMGGGESGGLCVEMFDALLRRQTLKPAGEAVITDASARGSRQLGQAAELELAGNRHKELVFGTGNWNSLGFSYWSRYVVTFDFPGGVIYLKPSRTYDQPDGLDMSGLAVIREDRRMVVHSVDEGGPAALAGIQAQDVIRQVNGKPAESVPLSDLCDLLYEKGKTVRFLLSRDGQEREVSLVPRDWRRDAAPAKEPSIPQR